MQPRKHQLFEDSNSTAHLKATPPPAKRACHTTSSEPAPGWEILVRSTTPLCRPFHMATLCVHEFATPIPLTFDPPSHLTMPSVHQVIVHQLPLGYHATRRFVSMKGCCEKIISQKSPLSYTPLSLPYAHKDVDRIGNWLLALRECSFDLQIVCTGTRAMLVIIPSDDAGFPIVGATFPQLSAAVNHRLKNICRSKNQPTSCSNSTNNTNPDSNACDPNSPWHSLVSNPKQLISFFGLNHNIICQELDGIVTENAGLDLESSTTESAPFGCEMPDVLVRAVDSDAPSPYLKSVCMFGESLKGVPLWEAAYAFKPNFFVHHLTCEFERLPVSYSVVVCALLKELRQTKNVVHIYEVWHRLVQEEMKEQGSAQAQGKQLKSVGGACFHCLRGCLRKGLRCLEFTHSPTRGWLRLQSAVSDANLGMMIAVLQQVISSGGVPKPSPAPPIAGRLLLSQTWPRSQKAQHSLVQPASPPRIQLASESNHTKHLSPAQQTVEAFTASACAFVASPVREKLIEHFTQAQAHFSTGQQFTKDEEDDILSQYVPLLTEDTTLNRAICSLLAWALRKSCEEVSHRVVCLRRSGYHPKTLLPRRSMASSCPVPLRKLAKATGNWTTDQPTPQLLRRVVGAQQGDWAPQNATFLMKFRQGEDKSRMFLVDAVETHWQLLQDSPFELEMLSTSTRLKMQQATLELYGETEAIRMLEAKAVSTHDEHCKYPAGVVSVVQDLSEGVDRLHVQVRNNVDDIPVPLVEKYISGYCPAYDERDHKKAQAVVERVVQAGRDKDADDAYENTQTLKATVLDSSTEFFKEGPQGPVQRNDRRFFVEVFKTATKGWCVRALDFIPKGSFVGRYVGELLDNHTAELRGQVYDRLHCSNLFDLKDRWHNTSDFDPFSKETDDVDVAAIDPMFYSNFTRFLSHNCEGNLRALEVACGEAGMYSAFFTTRDVQAGEELHFDYKYNLALNSMLCQCGEKTCRGLLHGLVGADA